MPYDRCEQLGEIKPVTAVSIKIATLVSQLDAAFAILEHAAFTGTLECQAHPALVARQSVKRLAALPFTEPGDFSAIAALYDRLIDIVGIEQEDMWVLERCLSRHLTDYHPEHDPGLVLG